MFLFGGSRGQFISILHQLPDAEHSPCLSVTLLLGSHHPVQTAREGTAGKKECDSPRSSQILRAKDPGQMGSKYPLMVSIQLIQQDHLDST